MTWKESISPKTGKKRYIDDVSGEISCRAPEGFGVIGEDDDDVELPETMTDEEIEARKAAAKDDPAWEGCGQEVGLEIWRVENKWTESGTPDFGVCRWPKEDAGLFYKGDSYIVLKTSQDEDSDGLRWDAHYWIGSESTQDEYGVAAYKAVELDCVLGGSPTQHREVMAAESALFLSYFNAIKYLDGGIESGFRSNKIEEFIPNLLRLTRSKNVTRAIQVPCEVASMSQQDTFVLDAGVAVYIWSGHSSNPFEKSKAAFVRQSIVDSRYGKANKKEVDDEFWAILGDSADSVAEASDDEGDDEVADAATKTAFEIMGRPAKLKRVEWSNDTSKLESCKVYLMDNGHQMFLWVGGEAPSYITNRALHHANHYRMLSGRSASLCRVIEGREKSTGMVAALGGP